MQTNLPANDDERLLQVARWARRRGNNAVAQVLTAALQGGDLADLERLMNPPAPVGKLSTDLPGGVAVFGLPRLTVKGGVIRLAVEPPPAPRPRLIYDRGTD
ncbi:hypothetical protein [Azospirillum brasilense]|uniref:Uncharacterized protein n=1 Tax=Azospirillum brasilense TaxID=192 RepID=A0A6L3B639_AZOBR|nr:hypothetical protein [Azospirillum brasilense]KAA0688477.1 hypothetical protein DS837_01740 [Azospirillum brasilense]